MTMHKDLHPREDIERLYVPRKKGGRDLARIEDCIDNSLGMTSIRRLEDNIKKNRE